MNVKDHDIARIARHLREEENQQLQVRPWKRHHHYRPPQWLVALPAAAIIGFLLGIWTGNHSQTDKPLAALTDTVYVTVEKAISRADTPQVAVTPHPSPVPERTRVKQSSLLKESAPTGRSMLDDRIRYDLLVKN